MTVHTPCRPDVQVFLQKKEREEKEKRDGKDDRSFLQKYVRTNHLVELVCPGPILSNGL